MVQRSAARISLNTVGIFAGIGGLELGLQRQGHSTLLLSEIDATAQAVLRKRFKDVSVVGDVRAISGLPDCDLVAAGFPCQDLSQCGKTKGIYGHSSSLITEAFRLVEGANPRPEWILLENVPFMLQLDRGRAMTFITSELRRLGYHWAYRTINAMAFGVPQRRLRVVLLAARTQEPKSMLFADDAAEPEQPKAAKGYGFYWTEGAKGLGWARDSVPTLKGGSTIGIPSPPAIWIPDERRLATIDIRDAERLQGFPVNWTTTRIAGSKEGARWKLVGNAVCVKVASWVGNQLGNPGVMTCEIGDSIQPGDRWPNAAIGSGNGVNEVIASTWPVARQPQPILSFLKFPLRPLSVRATAGFLSRARKSSLKFEGDFIADVAHYLETAAKIKKRLRMSTSRC
jgi:DNA (cytosine-5)-methyltransferase 1